MGGSDGQLEQLRLKANSTMMCVWLLYSSSLLPSRASLLVHLSLVHDLGLLSCKHGTEN